MLEQMRQGTQSFFVYIAFGILIVVFTFYFGPGTEGCQPSTRQAAASVDGSTLYNTDVTIILNRTNTNRRDLSESEWATLQGQALEKLALLHHLANKATDKGFEVDNKELAAFILDSGRNPEFRIYSKDGKFDPEVYDRYINNYLEVTVEDYEAIKGRELLVRKYLSSLEQSVTVLPGEVDELNKLRSIKVDLEYVKFDPKKLAEAISFTDAEAETWIAANADKIAKYYEDNKKDYGKPKRVRVRRLMIKKPAESADAGTKKTAEDKWNAAKSRVLDQKEAFEKVVSEVSEDIAYKDKGGDMGWSQLEDMNQDMAKVVDAMKAGEIKEHASNFAWFLLKLEEAEEAEQKTLDQVRGELGRKLMAEEAGAAQVEKLAGELLAKATADGSKDLQVSLDALTPKAPEPTPEPAEAPTDGEKPADAPTDAPADAPADGTEGEKKAEVPAVEPQKSPWSLLKVANTRPFARTPRQTFSFDPKLNTFAPKQLPWSDVQGIGDDKELAKAAFALTTDKPVMGKVYKVGEAWFVIRLKERTEATGEELTKSREAVLLELRNARVGAYLGPWQNIFYAPDADLKKLSPWLHKVYSDAIKDGKIEIKPGVFKAADAEEPVAPATPAGGAAAPKADDKAAPKTP